MSEPPGLSPAHSMLVRRLSAFSESFSLDAMVTIAHDVEGMSPFTAGMLDELLTRSLVVPTAGGGDRHRLTAEAKAGADEARRRSDADADARGAHLAWARALAEEANAAIDGPEQVFWVESLDAEEENLRAALDWACDRRGCEDALRLAAALGRYWEIKGRVQEGRRWLGAAIAANPQAARGLKAAGVSSAGLLAWRDRDGHDARRHFEHSLELHWELGDRRAAAGVLHSLGNIAFRESDYVEALRLYHESLGIARELGDNRIAAAALTNIGAVAEVQGNLDQARALYGDALVRWNQEGDMHNAAAVLANLTAIALAELDLPAAREHGEATVEARRLLGNPAHIAAALNELAGVATKQGDRAAAAGFHAEAQDLERASRSAARPRPDDPNAAPIAGTRARRRFRGRINRQRAIDPGEAPGDRPDQS